MKSKVSTYGKTTGQTSSGAAKGSGSYNTASSRQKVRADGEEGTDSSFISQTSA